MDTEKQAARWRWFMANYHAILTEATHQAEPPRVFFAGQGGNLRRPTAEIEAAIDAKIAGGGA